MRRFPISWTTLSARLGFKRKRKERSQNSDRTHRSRFEPLEPRHMLAVYMVNSTADTEVADNELTLREAVALANSEKTRPNGDVVRFNTITNEFGVIAPDGTIRTYFRPNPKVHGYRSNLDYYNAQ